VDGGRYGPNRVDLPWLGRLGGILPSGLAIPRDAIKLLFKEESSRGGGQVPLLRGPVLVLVPPSLGMIVVPLRQPDRDSPLQVANLSVGILFTMSVLSVAVYGLRSVAGRRTTSTRCSADCGASAQLISYELALGLSIIPR